MSIEEPSALMFARQDIRDGKASPIIESLVRLIDQGTRRALELKVRAENAEAVVDEQKSTIARLTEDRDDWEANTFEAELKVGRVSRLADYLSKMAPGDKRYADLIRKELSGRSS